MLHLTQMRKYSRKERLPFKEHRRVISNRMYTSKKSEGVIEGKEFGGVALYERIETIYSSLSSSSSSASTFFPAFFFGTAALLPPPALICTMKNDSPYSDVFLILRHQPKRLTYIGGFFSLGSRLVTLCHILIRLLFTVAHFFPSSTKQSTNFTCESRESFTCSLLLIKNNKVKKTYQSWHLDYPFAPCHDRLD